MKGNQLYELALFAGAGGGLLGSRLLGWRTVCYVEHNKYRVEVLKARIKDGYLDDAPIWDDVQTFDGRPWSGLVDIITAGFPCQPFSSAGKRLGERDERNRWPDTIRIIRMVRPEFILLENSARLTSHSYFNIILGDLAESGFDARWDCIPASAIGANHQRDRLWIVAHAIGRKCERGNIQSQCQKSTTRSRVWSRSEEDTNTNDGRWTHAANIVISDKTLQSGSDFARLSNQTCWQGGCPVEPAIQRVVDGLATWVDRLEAIGDGQVPAVVRAAWLLLNEWSEPCAA